MSRAFGARARETPMATAVADERQALPCIELDRLLNRIAHGLIASGLGGNARAAVFAGNCVEAACVYLGGLEAGVSTVPINFHLTAEEAAYILRDSGTHLLFVGPETAEAGLAAAELAGSVQAVVGWRCASDPRLARWEDWQAPRSEAEPPAGRSPRPHLHYTSGTTGRPKGAETPPSMFPRRDTVEDWFAAQRESFEAGGGRSPVMIVSPMYHTGPLHSVRAAAGGASLIVQSRFDAEGVLAAVERHRVKSFMMVPTHFQRLLALPDEVRGRHDLSSLDLVTHTGAACPVEVKRRMIAWLGPILVEAYGATESGSTNMITSEEWLRKPGSVGRTLAPFEPLVVGDDGGALGPNQLGQLYFRDTTGRGIAYHNDAEKTRAAHLEPGVFTLGEIGYVDDDGYVFITDRSSDMIVSGGVNIYPAEIEQVLVQHPDIDDAAVVGAPSAEMGEEVKALIVPRNPAKPPIAAELEVFCRSRLAGFKRPRSYEIVSDIGRNPMGKVNKRELRRRFWPTERTIG